MVSDDYRIYGNRNGWYYKQPGDCASHDMGKNFKVRSLDGCRDLCDGDASCRGFSFGKGGKCRLKNDVCDSYDDGRISNFFERIPRYYLANPGATVCPIGGKVNSKEECEWMAGFRPFREGDRTDIQVFGTDDADAPLDGAWGNVPLGCSVQTGPGGDGARHFKDHGFNENGGEYQLVCDMYSSVDMKWSEEKRGTDFPKGGHFDRVDNKTVEECKSLCVESENCVAITHKPDTNECYRKISLAGEKSVPGLNSYSLQYSRTSNFGTYATDD